MRKIFTTVFLLALFNTASFFAIIKCGGYTLRRGIKEFWGILLLGNLAIPFGMIFLV